MSTEPDEIYWDGNDLGKHYAVVAALGGWWMVGRRTLNPHTRQWSDWQIIQSKALPVSKTRAAVQAAFDTWKTKRRLRPIGQLEPEARTRSCR